GYQIDEDQSVAIMNVADEAGIDFIDTADVYPLGAPPDLFGRTEEIVGRWLKGRRERFIVASKCFFPTGPKPWDAGNSRQNIMRAVDESLRRLQTDHIDLYQVHSWDADVPIDETMTALGDLVTSGKVRYVGCSNYLAWQLALSIGRSEYLGVARFESVQPRYNLLVRENERELFPLCEHQNVAVIPYNPIAGGFLSGKHRPGAPTPGTRFTLGYSAERYQERYWHDRMFEVVEQLKGLADEAGVPLPTLAVQWVLANPVITSPIIGASRPEQLNDLVAAVSMPLDAELRQRLDVATREFRFGDNAR
ncbi:MAG: aldo/keto reductase, partial [Ilumatobacteraceae bacterium]